MKIKLIDFLKQQGIKVPNICINCDEGSPYYDGSKEGYNQCHAEWSNIEVEVPEELDEKDLEIFLAGVMCHSKGRNPFSFDLKELSHAICDKFGQCKEQRK